MGCGCSSLWVSAEVDISDADIRTKGCLDVSRKGSGAVLDSPDGAHKRGTNIIASSSVGGWEPPTPDYTPQALPSLKCLAETHSLLSEEVVFDGISKVDHALIALAKEIQQNLPIVLRCVPFWACSSLARR